ncbi:choline dehydrogenase-like flavoprotein [Micromonospora sp. Llam0]|uniref:GMC family oxidoreductase N-terminal domain-containing protein n=1 Tax=Micromonospora sp. Llam0 TaxID=2485143 RepID=UPI000F9B5F8B|nr:GMC family oxidoreductase N-terminal domain-containing protein [Micromonospora sp. Llam0]ROO60593.1 choline dehydrogenase-like flavoprotein [Micromonospora sp. Llam0]
MNTFDPALVRAVCDTLLPRVAANAADSADAATLLGLSASDAGIDTILSAVLPGFAPHVRESVAATLTALGDDFVNAGAAERTAAWRGVLAKQETYPGAIILQSTALAMFYTAPDAEAKNPTWPAIGYPGPLLPVPTEAEFPRTLRTIGADDDLSADAIVVGSGAGGGVAAARLSAAGLRVLVLEKGSYRNEPDLPQLEALAFPNLYLGGGFLWSTSASVGLLAGSTVGGGTTVNSMACLPTPGYVVDEWRAYGMTGLDAYDEHVRAVLERINATPANTVHNRVNQILIRGFEAAGLAYATLARNARDNDDRYCGECNAGCLTGCKQSTMKTFLQDASDTGTRLLPDCDVREILTSDGRAVGVRAVVAGREIVAHAPIVVVAAGALATPTLLLASAIGGPAVGHNLHVHPSYFMSGVFDEDVRGWAGQILTSVSHEFDHVEGDHGFVVEAAPMGLGFWTALTPWHDGASHKREQLRLRHVSGVWGFTRDHGSGRVELGPDGMPLIHWELADEVDLAIVRRCHIELARLLRAAGAREIFTFLPGDPRWREGEDFDAFLGVLGALDGPEVLTLSAHQSGTCPTGTDPATSVVDGRGQLHDVRGVYVADAAALPTAPGVNPMVSIEAYAARTAGHIIEDWTAGTQIC